MGVEAVFLEHLGRWCGRRQIGHRMAGGACRCVEGGEQRRFAGPSGAFDQIDAVARFQQAGHGFKLSIVERFAVGQRAGKPFRLADRCHRAAALGRNRGDVILLTLEFCRGRIYSAIERIADHAVARQLCITSPTLTLPRP